MSNIVGEVNILVKPVDTGFGQRVQQIIDKAEANSNITPDLDPSKVVKGAEAANRAVAGATANMTNNFDKVAGVVGTAAAALLGIKAAVDVVVGGLDKLFSGLIKASAGFNAILGAEQGDALLQQIRQFAKDTPFATEGLIKYSQQLLGVGLAAEKVVPLLGSIGDLVASKGGDSEMINRVLFTLTQIQSVGRLIGQDALQLQSALIPITALLSDSLGKTTDEVKALQAAGKITSEQVFSALTDAGYEVAGAMDAATNSIAGAREGLADTLQILGQDNNFLSDLNDQVVLGIKKVTEILSSDRTAEILTDISDSAAGLYEAFTPFFELMGSVSLESTLTIVEATSAAMKAFSAVLNALPEQAITLLITFFAFKKFNTFISGITTVAGTMTRFSGTLRGVGAGLLSTTGAIKGAGDQATLSARQIAAAEQKIEVAQKARLAQQARNAKMAGQLGTGAALAFGAAAVAGDNGAGDAATIAAYGLTGAAIGVSVGGPLGAALGGAAGVGIGAISKALERERELEAANRSKWAKLGTEAAEAYANSFDGITRLETEAQVAAAKLLTEFSAEGGEKVISAAERSALDLLKLDIPGRTISVAGMDRETINTSILKEQIALYADATSDADLFLRKQQEVVQAILDSPDNTTLKGPTQGPADMFTRERTMSDVIEDATETLGAFQVDINELTAGKLSEFVGYFNGITAAMKESSAAAVEFNTKVDENRAKLKGVFAADTTQASSLLALEKQKEAFDGIVDGLGALTVAGKSASSVQVGEAALKALALAQEQAALSTGTQVEANQIFYDSLREIGLATGMNEHAIGEMIESYELLDVYTQAASTSTQGMTQSVMDFAAQSGVSTDRVAELLEGIDALPADIMLYLDVDTLGALRALADVEAAIARIAGDNDGDGPATRLDNNPRQADRRAEVIADTAGIAEESIKRAASQIRAGTSTPKGGKSAAADAAEDAAAMAEQAALAVENAGDSLVAGMDSAVESIKAAAEAWKSSVKERIQYDRAVSASRATRNATSQIDDIRFLTAGIAELQSRGLTESAIAGLGIDGIEDVKQVRKLLKASDPELSELSTSIGNRDELAAQLAETRGRDETKRVMIEAIVAAAGILGFEVDEERAAQIEATFTINGATDTDAVAESILNTLTSGVVSR
jgi:tape measure domain-containing protein